MKTLSLSRKLAGGVLLLACLCAPVALAQQAPVGSVNVRGVLFDAQTGQPLSGAVVKLVHLDTKHVYQSQPSNSKGQYAVENMPFGYYDAVAIHDGGTGTSAYLANRVINAPAGETIDLSFSLGPVLPEDSQWWSRDVDRMVPGVDQKPSGVARIIEGRPDSIGARVAKKTPSAAGGSERPKWLIPTLAAAGVLGAAVLLDDDDDDAVDSGATPFM